MEGLPTYYTSNRTMLLVFHRRRVPAYWNKMQSREGRRMENLHGHLHEMVWIICTEYGLGQFRKSCTDGGGALHVEIRSVS